MMMTIMMMMQVSCRARPNICANWLKDFFFYLKFTTKDPVFMNALISFVLNNTLPLRINNTIRNSQWAPAN